MKKTTAAICAVLLSLTACGSGDDDTAKKNIKASILEEEAGMAAGTKPTEKQAGCMADGMVDEVGVEKLQEYKILDKELKIDEDAEPTDLEKADAESLAGVIVDCVDMAKMIEDQMGQGAQTELTDEQSKCIGDAIDEDTIEAGLAASFQGKEEDNPMGEMQAEMMKCAMPSGG